MITNYHADDDGDDDNNNDNGDSYESTTPPHRSQLITTDGSLRNPDKNKKNQKSPLFQL